MASSFKVGESVSKMVVFDDAAVRSFAVSTGDMSPLHHDAKFASSTRFGGLIVSGGQLSALMMGMVATFLTARRAGLGLEFDFKFKKAVVAGESFTAEWRIVAIEPTAKYGGDVIELEGAVVNGKGEACVAARSRCLSLLEEMLVRS
ncbi:TPA: MaoC family dehydratase [Pseudomonas aeruginosa]|nr:MaoC family dehydratase [Pseudomonas aeruginosa]